MRVQRVCITTSTITITIDHNNNYFAAQVRGWRARATDARHFRRPRTLTCHNQHLTVRVIDESGHNSSSAIKAAHRCEQIDDDSTRSKQASALLVSSMYIRRRARLLKRARARGANRVRCLCHLQRATSSSLQWTSCGQQLCAIDIA